MSASSPMTPAPLPNPRVLFCCLSTPAYYRRPLFSEREVFCGPDCETVQGPQGFTSIRSPAGEYDLAGLIRQLPADQRPDLIVVKADATCRNSPRNLDAIDCPKAFIIGDTHHFHAPVRKVLRYAMAENFDCFIADHTRHHAHYFREAGLDNVHWIPAVDYGLRLRSIPTDPVRPLTFIGQAGRFHPYRRKLLDALRAAGLPLEVLHAHPEATADLQANSQVTLNCSLNGDLNLRVFEALGSGAFLITDELTPESGLNLLFEDGRHLVQYRTAGELIEKARHYLDHPDEAMALRTAGQKELLERHHPHVKTRQFFDLVFDGKVDPQLDLGRDARYARPISRRNALFGRIALYEAVQQIHRTATAVPVYLPASDCEDLAQDLIDLPRVTVHAHTELEARVECPAVFLRPDGEIGAEPVLLLPWTAPDTADRLLPCFPGRHVLVPLDERRAAVAPLAAWGYAPDGEAASPLFVCRQPLRMVERANALGLQDLARALLRALAPTLRSAEAAFEAARLSHALGELELELACLETCIGLDRNHQRALLGYARAAEMLGRPTEAYFAVAERNRLLPPSQGDRAREDTLWAQCDGDSAVAKYRSIVSRVQKTAQPRRILVVNNLFPPQEMGGYGRKLWEFAAELLHRGHEVRVLTADAAYLHRPPSPGSESIEPHVRRVLQLYGAWRNGKTVVETDRAQAMAMSRANAQSVAQALDEIQADACLYGNLDFLGPDCLDVPLRRGIPVVHCFGNKTPGYPLERKPDSPLYCAGPASHWLAQTMAEAGFDFTRRAVVYPGARVDYFYRHFMPVRDKLRILFAGLVLPYKGPQVLVNALGMLHREGVDFECVLAGDSTSSEFIDKLSSFIQKQGMAPKFRLPGFLDRAGLARAINTSNVLVFPSQVDETFGISQVEAMSAGLTVITSGTGGSQEIIRNGVDGLVFERGSHEDLASKFRNLLADPQRWEALALAGRERATEFAIPRSVDVIEHAFTEMLAQR